MNENLSLLEPQIHPLNVPWVGDAEDLLVEFSIVHPTIVLRSLAAAEPVGKWEGGGAVGGLSTFPRAGIFPS
jgi:hypothetical protein